MTTAAATPPGALLAEISRRARGDRNRPRADDDTEKRLERIEEQSAACYAELEGLAWRIRSLAKEIDSAAIPEPIDEGDSAVFHIGEASRKLS